MSVVPLLLRTIVDADGDTLVMHLGEKPYLTGPNGRFEIGDLALTPDALNGMVAQLVPADLRRALAESGSIQFELPPDKEFEGERFSVAARRSAAGLRLEIERRRGLARPDGPTAVVLPMSRPVRHETGPSTAADAHVGLGRLLRHAASRGASALHLASGSVPSIRIGDAMQLLESESVLAADEILSVLSAVASPGTGEPPHSATVTEWAPRIDGIARVRCISFRDHRGPGAVFRLIAARAKTLDELELAPDVQALAIEPQGLILVAGSRSSGAQDVMAGFVDRINQIRRDHVVAIDRQLSVIHRPGSSQVSQREASTDEEMLMAARAAMLEDPDVLILGQIRSDHLMNVALDAASSGHLVIAGISAPTVVAAVESVVRLYAPAYGAQVRIALAEALRAVIAHRSDRTVAGHGSRAREILLNGPEVARAIAEGALSELPRFVTRDAGGASVAERGA